MQKTIQRRLEHSTFQPFSNKFPETLQRVLWSRGIQDEADLNYRLTELLRPDALTGLTKASLILANAVEQGEKILVVGDFDADGATSSALAILALQSMGAIDPDYLVPNRFEYGYGLTPEIVAVALERHPQILVTVDNGIASIEGVAMAKAQGLKVVVTDHHLPGDALPNADAIVNPNQHGCGFLSKSLAGVGVIFYVMSALRAELKNRGWFVQEGIPEPKMADFLDLVALGTVADVVPLDTNNRILVQQGIKRIQQGQCRAGILALLAIGGRNHQELKASDLGFVVGPRLNAAGRLEDMSIGIECLLTESLVKARELANELNALNQARKHIESDMKDQAESILSNLLLDQALPNGLCFYDPQWHQGVIGILASRMKEKCHRPVIAFAQAERGVLKGSARSIPGLHIRDALDVIAKRQPHLLSKFGGHAMAAGMSIEADKFEDFQKAFNAVVTELLTPDQLEACVVTDGELQPEDYSLSFAELIRQSGPWGQHFPEPVFDGVFEVVQQRLVGEKHLKLLLREPHSALLLDAIAFFIDLSVWPNAATHVRLVYKLEVNEFRGQRNLQLMVEYIEPIE